MTKYIIVATNAMGIKHKNAPLKPEAPPPNASETEPRNKGPGTAPKINEIIVPIPMPVVRCLAGNTSVHTANKPGNTNPEQNEVISAITMYIVNGPPVEIIIRMPAIEYRSMATTRK